VQLKQLSVGNIASVVLRLSHILLNKTQFMANNLQTQVAKFSVML